MTGDHCFEKLVHFPCSVNLKYLFEAHVKCLNIQWFSDVDSRLLNYYLSLNLFCLYFYELSLLEIFSLIIFLISLNLLRAILDFLLQRRKCTTNLANMILQFYYLARVNVNFHEGLQFIATAGKGAGELTGF